MAKFADHMDKIAQSVTEGYKKIESGTVSGYKKIEDGVVGSYKRIEAGVVGSFNKISDKFVDTFLAREGEPLENAKARLAREQADREEAAKNHTENHTNGMK